MLTDNQSFTLSRSYATTLLQRDFQGCVLSMVFASIKLGIDRCGFPIIVASYRITDSIIKSCRTYT